MFRSLLSFMFVREFLVQDVLYLHFVEDLIVAQVLNPGDLLPSTLGE